jgi:hypothetical protein
MATPKSKVKPTPRHTKKKPVASTKNGSAPKKSQPVQVSLAVKTLSTLPALTGKLRSAFRAAFNDEQCDAWGEKTKAEQVIREAEKFVAVMAAALDERMDVTYSRRRLTYLCELLVLLEDEVRHTDGSTSRELRSARSATLAVAVHARRDLARRLRALAGGQQKLLQDIANASPANEQSPTDVQDSLTATIDLALKLRRNEVIETHADDIGLTEARLNGAYSALEGLAGAREIGFNAAQYDGDAPSVNRIEGRVLREMRLAQRMFNESREAGVKLPALVVGPSLKSIFGSEDNVEAPAPTPPPA